MGLFSGGSRYLGIDIGDSSIKMVELQRRAGRMVLANYALGDDLSKRKFTTVEDVPYLASVIKKIKKDSGINSVQASVSLPSFSVFSAVISLSNINRKDLAQRVNEEAHKVIPLPIDDMVLDWKIIPSTNKNDKDLRIFLTGSPKKLIKKYLNIFKAADIELVDLETETFSQIRALIGNDQSTVMMLDLGANSTDVCIVKGSVPYLNRSLNISGLTIDETMAKRLGVDNARAEELKLDMGLASLSEGGVTDVPSVITSAIEPILSEVRYMMELFKNSNNEPIEKIILSGGGALLISLSNYLESVFNIKVVVGNPWRRVAYPRALKPILTELGPRLTVAIGLALRNIDVE